MSLSGDAATEVEPDPLPERPLRETQIGQVWDIADEITREKGRLAQRNEVIDRFVGQGREPKHGGHYLL